MKVLGIDFGQKRIGIAVGNTSDGIAFPRESIANSPDILTVLCDLAQAEQVSRIIVGLPLNLQGGEARIVAPARNFADSLEDALLKQERAIPVDFFDERFTSKIAQQAGALLGNSHKSMRGNLDSAAAALLLESFFAYKKAQKREA